MYIETLVLYLLFVVVGYNTYILHRISKIEALLKQKKDD